MHDDQSVQSLHPDTASCDKALTSDSADETIDVFHRGAFYLVQPALKGHRSGIDAMILASIVPCDFSGKVADMGAGAGAAALAVAARCPKAEVVLIERSGLMLNYARKTLALTQNSEIAKRASIIDADVSLNGKSRNAAGLHDNSYDFVMMNPPFNSGSDRRTPDPLKAEAHVMPDGMFESWIRTASGIVKPNGRIGIIARPTSLPEILTHLHRRFGGLTIVPIHARPQEPAIRIVITGTSGSRAALTLAPALILHNYYGNEFTDRAIRITNGRESLFHFNSLSG